MGARPIAILDSLRFGDPASARTRWLVDGVVRGIGHYGNCIGVATVGGEVAFDPSYDGNPLVNALAVGVLRADRIQLARAEAVGDVAVLIGQRTGRDGIGGASVLASAEFDEAGADDAKRPNVQVGDPFAGKLLIESCLELYERGLLSGIQDMGAAGIACSSAEMASAAGLGLRLDLDRVPLREPSMEAWEILCSESQERMLALVSPENLDEVLGVCARWGVDATPIGEVVEGNRLQVFHRGELVHDAPADSIAHDSPVYRRPVTDWVNPAADEDVDSAAGPVGEEELRGAVLALLASPNVADPRWIYQQYDSIVQSGTVQGPGADAAVLRLPEPDGSPAVDGRRGIALAVDGNGRWCWLDPREGARLAVAEAARNVACTGATPVAATNCLNFGSPERPEIMGQFRDAIAGMREACLALGTPITGGNVSFYNQTGDVAVHPTPVIGVLGVLADVTAAVGRSFTTAGDALLLVGAATRPGLGGSEHQWVSEGRSAGRPPRIDLDEEARLQRLLVEAARRGLLRSAHDVSVGGLITTVVESCLPADLGADLEPEEGLARHQWLFSESPSRVVVSTADADALAALCAELDVPVRALGTVVAAPRIRVADWFTLELAEARAAVESGLPQALGEAA